MRRRLEGLTVDEVSVEISDSLMQVRNSCALVCVILFVVYCGMMGEILGSINSQ